MSAAQEPREPSSDRPDRNGWPADGSADAETDFDVQSCHSSASESDDELDSIGRLPSMATLRSYQARLLAWADPFSSLDAPRKGGPGWTPSWPSQPPSLSWPQWTWPQSLQPGNPEAPAGHPGRQLSRSHSTSHSLSDLQSLAYSLPQNGYSGLENGLDSALDSGVNGIENGGSEHSSPGHVNGNEANGGTENSEHSNGGESTHAAAIAGRALRGFLAQHSPPFSFPDNIFNLENIFTEIESESEPEGEDDDEDNDLDNIGHMPTLSVFNETLRSASRMLLSTVSQAILDHNTRVGIAGEALHDDAYSVLDASVVDVTVTEEDLEPSFVPDTDILGCAHYHRNCKVLCADCNKWYPCRLCHNEEEMHELPRQKTQYMLCMFCRQASPAGKHCAHCREEMADQYCGVCRLWSGDPEKPIFHCDDCGICRVGEGIGIDVYHCKTCDMCMAIDLMDSHVCVEKSTRSNCPICQENLFTSTRPVLFMPCGHPIHQACFDFYMKSSYRCPVCARSAINTTALFSIIEKEIEQEVLPPEYANLHVNVRCNDCRGKSRTEFHVAGRKCMICGSYNTWNI